jgi:hypothetical protein
VEHAVRRCKDSRFPPDTRQSGRQVTNDIAHAPDFPTRQRAVFRGNKYDVLGTDGSRPF